MIKIPVPKEIRQYETKLLGPFSARQTVCLAIGAVLSIGLLLLQKYLFGTEPTDGMGPCVLVIGVCMLFTAKFYGLKFEEYIVTYIYDNFLSPPKRKYETENYYQKISKPYTPIKMKNGKQVIEDEKKKKKNEKKIIKRTKQKSYC